ncbi:TetR/AcrR family transcriptional regulator C-terminal domain-containing protein [Streptomyces anandii]|uniref:TetR/AcrR family transcriptional regulator C-terminal domain-containing protein n=1 Tax=Streptomyces anandii TaxID=285454 RepID=A0ABW6H6A6_9ACTN
MPRTRARWRPAEPYGTVRRDDLPSLHTLATGIDRDRDAVIARLTLPWNSGVVEGHIANAFPDLGANWYEQGFQRVLATLADTFHRLADRGPLRIDDLLLAANQFSGLLLWIPVNKAMFHGSPITHRHHPLFDGPSSTDP